MTAQECVGKTFVPVRGTIAPSSASLEIVEYVEKPKGTLLTRLAYPRFRAIVREGFAQTPSEVSISYADLLRFWELVK